MIADSGNNLNIIPEFLDVFFSLDVFPLDVICDGLNRRYSLDVFAPLDRPEIVKLPSRREDASLLNP